MTLLAFYNAIINVTKECGQGVPLFVAMKAGLVYELDELVTVGKLKKVGKGDPAMTFYCLPDIFCVEEGDLIELFFVRKYLNDESLPDSLVDKYDDWKEKNIDGLVALTELSNVTEI